MELVQCGSFLAIVEQRVMPKVAPQNMNMTERQRKWFATVRSGLEAETGRSLAEWVAIAKLCPESGTRARLKWFKETHGLLQNRAMYVLSQAFPSATGWDRPEALKETLWADASCRAILAAVDTLALQLPGVVASQRKGFSGWSERLKTALVLQTPRDVNGRIAALLKAAWQAS
jgi:hypothetical protein